MGFEEKIARAEKVPPVAADNPGRESEIAEADDLEEEKIAKNVENHGEKSIEPGKSEEAPDKAKDAKTEELAQMVKQCRDSAKALKATILDFAGSEIKRAAANRERNTSAGQVVAEGIEKSQNYFNYPVDLCEMIMASRQMSAAEALKFQDSVFTYQGEFYSKYKVLSAADPARKELSNLNTLLRRVGEAAGSPEEKKY